MNSAAVTMELSIAYLSWINTELRSELTSREMAAQASRREIKNRKVVVASVASLCIAILSICVQL